MPQFRLPAVLAVLAAGLVLSGCGKEPRPQIQPGPEQPALVEPKKGNDLLPGQSTGSFTPITSRDRDTASAEVATLKPMFAPVAPPEPTKQEQYDTALLNALNLLADRKHAQALAALEAARAIQDTEQVRQQIERLKALLDQGAAAERYAQDVQIVLDGGKPEEAAKLATAGLQQYGATDVAERLIKQKLQAEALLAARTDDKTAQRARLRQEAETALRDQNLPAASIALEQALQYGDDPDLRQRLDGVKVSLSRYQENRTRAAELRKDPVNLEDAIAALQEADRAWDTPQVRQEIDECNLALQKRRDRLAIADFEVRGDVGIPVAGRAVAEELLTGFKPRYDLVERGQLARVLDELRLEGADLGTNEAGRREVGRITRVRYLVVGSLTAFNGITISARLVEVPSGLVVQTARLVARDPQEMMTLLPQVANILMMNDAQKMAYEQQLAQQVPAVTPIIPVATLPPLPEIGQPAPPPLIVYSPRPPDFGGLQPRDFDQLQPVVLVPAPAPAVVVIQREDPYRQRTVQVAVELGDNLFRRGRYREAHAQFELALSFSPHRTDLSIRVERCRPHLPPPVVVVAPPPPPLVIVAPAPPVVYVPVARPRIAILNFVVNADPGRVPSSFGDWAAEQMTAYFNPMYEVVERGEVCWYMGRLGITMRDVVYNPSARVCLGRALNVRFLVMGAIQQTASFDVSTHLVDVESGGKQGGGKIHVQDSQELKLRLGELVHQTANTTPGQAPKLQEDAKDIEKVLNDARQLLQKGQSAQAAAVCQEGLKRHPGHAGIQAMLHQAEQQVQVAKLEEGRRQEQKQQQAQTALAQQKQQALARDAESARRLAEQQAAARTDAERRAQEGQKQRAFDDLLAGGRRAVAQANYPQAVQMLQSAVALKPNEAVATRELAQAKAKADEAVRAKAVQEQAQKEAAQRKQREDDLARARNQVAEANRQRAAAEQTRHQAQEARDQAAYTKYLTEGRQLLAGGKYEAALSSLQSARQLRQTDEVKALLTQAQDKLAQAEAQKKGAQGKAELERLAQEKAAREKADALAKRNQDTYNQALQAAQKALADKRYDEAIAKFQEAGKIFRTDVVLNGQHQAEEARTKERAAVEAAKRKQTEDQQRLAAEAERRKKAAEDQQRAASDAEKRKKADEQQRGAEVQRLLREGDAALTAKQFDSAAKAFNQVATLMPGSAEARAGLARTEQARREGMALAQRQKEELDRLTKFRIALDTGRAHLAAKRYDAALAALNEAVKINPTDPTARAVLKEAENARGAADLAQRKKDEEQRAERVRQLLASGRAALNGKQFDAASKAFGDAAKLAPTDPAVAKALQDLDQARRAAASADAEQTKRLQIYQQNMTAGKQALAARRYDDAAKWFTEAGKIQPGNPEVAAMLQEVEKGRAAARAAQEMDARKKQQEEQARRNEFTRLMGQGRSAMTAKRYDDAVKAFTDALRYQPGNPEATRALQDAEQARKGGKK